MQHLLPLLLVLGACPPKDEPEDRTADILLLTGDIEEGGRLYVADCELCHSSDGTGGTGADLTASLVDLTREEAIDTVLSGNEVMPRWGDIKDDQAIADVVAYIFDTFGP